MRLRLSSLRLLAVLCCPFIPAAQAVIEYPMDNNPTVTPSDWFGCMRHDFVIAGRPALLIVPEKPAPGKPWIWRTEWFGHAPQVDLALVARGWHVGYMNVKDMYGGPDSMKLLDAYYQHVRTHYGLAPKVVMEGFSRGGLYAMNFAATWPERTAALYLDAPALDLTSWPSRKSRLWPECLASYGVTDAQFDAAGVNPIDRFEVVARAGIPIFGVSGDADESVKYEANLGLLVTRYHAAGGLIEVVVKPGGKHHPHSLSDPKPIVDFLIAHAKQ